MFSQLEEEIRNVGRKGFWAVPVENGIGGTSVNYRVPKMNFGRREIKNWGNTEGYQAEGLEMREGSLLKVMICTDEERGRGEPCVEGREWPIVWTMYELA